MIHIAYSLATGRVRGWTVFTPAEIASGHARPAGKGEGVLVVAEKQYGNLNQLQALATQATGIVPANDRYVFVDRQSNQIVAVHVCDPACGDMDAPHLQGCDAYAHPAADQAWTFNPVAKTVTSPALSAQDISAIKAAKGLAWAAPTPTVDAVSAVVAVS